MTNKVKDFEVHSIKYLRMIERNLNDRCVFVVDVLPEMVFIALLLLLIVRIWLVC